jgi:hypothetical protein
MSIGEVILPGFAILIVIVVAYVTVRWVLPDRDDLGPPPSKTPQTPRR